MLKLLAAPAPAPILAVMSEQSVLRHALPAKFSVSRLAGMVEAERLASLSADRLRRLAALIIEGPAGAERVSERWRLANAERDRLVALAAPEPVLTPDLPSELRRRCLYRLGPDLWRDRALLHWAERLAEVTAGDESAWRDLLDLPSHWNAPQLPVLGRDLVALGLPTGPEVGRLLAQLEEWWIEQNFAPGRAECLAWAEAQIKNR